jgi:hypothetical protein
MSNRYCYLLASGNEFHLVPARKQTTGSDIYLLLYVQSWTPDDGQKDCPKHVECYSKIKHLITIWQGRLFSYSDTHRHRLGANYLQIPVNCPYRTRITNYQRDGPQTFTNNQEGAPNYYPNSFNGPEDVPDVAASKFAPTGDIARQAQWRYDVLCWTRLLQPSK